MREHKNWKIVRFFPSLKAKSLQGSCKVLDLFTWFLSLLARGKMKKTCLQKLFTLRCFLGGGFIFLFSAVLGEMVQCDYIIFFTWFETTNQLNFGDVHFRKHPFLVSKPQVLLLMNGGRGQGRPVTTSFSVDQKTGCPFLGNQKYATLVCQWFLPKIEGIMVIRYRKSTETKTSCQKDTLLRI